MSWSCCTAACLCRFQRVFLPCPSFLAAVLERRHCVAPCCVFQSRTGRRCSVRAAGRVVTCLARLCLQPQKKSVLLFCAFPPDVSWLAGLAVGGTPAAALLPDWPAVCPSVRRSGWSNVPETFAMGRSLYHPPTSTPSSSPNPTPNQFVVGRRPLTTPPQPPHLQQHTSSLPPPL